MTLIELWKLFYFLEGSGMNPSGKYASFPTLEAAKIFKYFATDWTVAYVKIATDGLQSSIQIKFPIDRMIKFLYHIQHL